MCEGTVDLNVTIDVPEADPFDLSEPDPRAGPEPLVWVPPKPAPRKKITVSKRTLWISAGVAGAIAVGTYAAALASRSKYDDLANPDLRTPGDLKSQRAKTNTLVGISAGGAVAAGGLVAAAVMTGNF